jgi:hypothetical protein
MSASRPKYKLVRVLVGSICALLATVAWPTTKSALMLHMSWPSGWEYRPTEQIGDVIYLEARQRVGAKVVQRLNMTLMGAQPTNRMQLAAGIADLAQRLRDMALGKSVEREIPLRPFAKQKGYYFVATGVAHVATDDGRFKQTVEGVILASDYVLNVKLLTNDASSKHTSAILKALDELRVAQYD